MQHLPHTPRHRASQPQASSGRHGAGSSRETAAKKQQHRRRTGAAVCFLQTAPNSCATAPANCCVPPTRQGNMADDNEGPTTYHVTLPDGRQLAYAVLGLPLGSHEPPEHVVVYHHGWPSCRYEALPLHEPALAQKLRVLAVDRPGIGGSSPHPEGNYETWADDVAALLDEQKVAKAIILGMSGGGPWAMAVARYRPERVAALVLVASMTSTLGTAQADEARRKMSWADQAVAAAVSSPLALKAALVAAWPLFMASPSLGVINALPESVAGPINLLATSVGFAEPDRKLVADNPRLMWRLLPQMLQQCMAQGTGGLERDMLLTSNPWPFELGDVKAPHTLVFWGAEDINVPRAMAERLANELPGAKLEVCEGEGHLSLLVNRCGDVLRAAVAALGGGGK